MEFNAMEASAKECLAYYQAKLDEEAWEAKKNGKLVCWSASVAPPEFCVAMDIAMFILKHMQQVQAQEKHLWIFLK